MNRTLRLAALWFLLLLLGIPLLAGTASAQSVWLDRKIDRAVWLEVQKADFSKDYLSFGGFITPPPKTTFLTTNWYLSARWRVASLFVLRGEIPFVNAGESFPIGRGFETVTISENQFGNPYVGVEIGRLGVSSFGEIGIRFPLVDDEHPLSSEFGTLTDYDRFDAFSPNVWTFTAIAKVQLKSREGLLLHVRAGPSFFLPTESGPDPELFGDYGAQIGYQGDRLTLLGGFTGRGWLTENDLANRFIDQFGLSASYAAGSFIPGVQLRLPMDAALSNILDFVFGLNLGYRLP